MRFFFLKQKKKFKKINIKKSFFFKFFWTNTSQTFSLTIDGKTLNPSTTPAIIIITLIIAQ